MKRIVILFVLGCFSSIINGQTKEIEQTLFFDSGKDIPIISSHFFKTLTDSIDPKTITKVIIKGHTDNIGSTASNQSLSENRALRIGQQILNYGVDQKNVVTIGYGEILITYQKEESSLPQASVTNNLLLDSIPEIDPEPCIGIKEDIESSSAFVAFFSGALISDNNNDNWTTEVLIENEYSQYVDFGEYPNNEEAFQKASSRTLDGLAINEGTRLLIYKKPNFKGRILLDISGPAIVNNSKYELQRPGIKKKTFKSKLQQLFPPSKRKWSRSNMHRWKKGSMKILSQNS